MLKTISPLISPELLKTLAEMGHGDEIIFADAHFPAHSLGPKTIRADGLLISDLLAAVIPLFELDSYAPPLVMMAPVDGDTLDIQVEARLATHSLVRRKGRGLRVLTVMRFMRGHRKRTPSW